MSATSTDERTPRRPRVDPRLTRRRAEIGRAAGRRRLALLGVFLGLIALCVLALVALHSSLFSARAVTVTGAVATPEATILQVSGLADHPALLDVNAAAAADAIEQLPWIATAKVSVHWPDGVSVVVTERRTVATWQVRAGDVLLLDDTGRVLEVVPKAPAGLVPVTLRGTALSAGSTLPASDGAIVRTAAAVPESILHDIVSLQAGSTGVEVALASGAHAELGQATDLHAKMVALATLLDTPSVGLTSSSVIDLRVPEAPIVSQ